MYQDNLNKMTGITSNIKDRTEFKANICMMQIKIKITIKGPTTKATHYSHTSHILALQEQRELQGILP